MKKILKKIWHFIWHEDDIATFKGFMSLLVNLVLAFIIIKFIFYPGIGLALNTDYPIVGVLSESMEHQLIHPCKTRNLRINECTERNQDSYEICGNQYTEWFHIDFDGYWNECGKWYEENSITKQHFNNFKLKNGFSKGDLLIIYGSKPENIEPGDIIVFEASRQYPIIHRVVKKYEEDNQVYYQTKGDHNKDSINDIGLNELKIPHDEKIFKGKAIFWFPYLGYVKIIPTNMLKTIFK